jgi:Beta-lactamase superfamily domain
MRPIFHPCLVNGRCGDPTVYVETLFEKHGLLFDVGEIVSLSARKIRRVDQIFVSHAHIDHFVGFDHLLRSLVGHEKTVQLYGPAGFAERVFHKLQAYRWNLVENYPCDLVFAVSELETQNSMSTTRFRLRRAFAAEPLVSRKTIAGVLCDELTHRVLCYRCRRHAGQSCRHHSARSECGHSLHRGGICGGRHRIGEEPGPSYNHGCRRNCAASQCAPRRAVSLLSALCGRRGADAGRGDDGVQKISRLTRRLVPTIPEG